MSSFQNKPFALFLVIFRQTILSQHEANKITQLANKVDGQCLSTY